MTKKNINHCNSCIKMCVKPTMCIDCEHYHERLDLMFNECYGKPDDIIKECYGDPKQIKKERIKE